MREVEIKEGKGGEEGTERCTAHAANNGARI